MEERRSVWEGGEEEGDRKTREGMRVGNVREEREEAMNKGNDAQAMGDPH